MAVDAEELEKSILRDKRVGKLSKRSIELFWDLINLRIKKGNYRGYDEDTKADMSLQAFTFLSKYWKNYVPYQITVILDGDPPKEILGEIGAEKKGGKVSFKWDSEWRTKVGVLRNAGYLKKVTVRRFSIFSYYLQYVENAFKNVLNKKKSDPFNGFQYRTGENGGSINGHVVVGHTDKETKYGIRRTAGFDAVDEIASSLYGQTEESYHSLSELEPVSGNAENRKGEIELCGKKYRVIYDRDPLIDMLAEKSSTPEDMIEYAKSLIIHDPSAVKTLKKDEVFMYLALEYERASGK